MKRMFILAVLCWMPAAAAQEGVKPGEEHKGLAKAVGTWDIAMKMAGPDGKPMECKGTATFKMELGDLWLVQNVEMEMFGQKFNGRGLDTYCPNKKKYVGVWFDSMSTSYMALDGTFDKDKKTLTMTGDAPDHTGKNAKHTLVTTWKDDDNFTFKMSVGDSKEPMMTIEYKRKK